MAEISLDQTRREFDRTEALHKKGVVSDEEYEQGRTALRKAQEELQNAKENMEIVKNGITSRYKELSNTQIRSTINGMILDVPVKIPENVFVRAGYSANASIVIQSREGVLTLPESTVEFEGDKTYVYLLTSADGAEEQTFDKHEVKIGLSDGINIELTEGVTAESKVRGAREEKKK